MSTLHDFTLRNILVIRTPHKGGVRSGGNVKMGFREAWEKTGLPSLYYKVSGDAPVRCADGEVHECRVVANIPAKCGFVQGVPCVAGLGTKENPFEREIDGVWGQRSDYQSDICLKTTVDANGNLALDEAPVVGPDGSELPIEWGVEMLLYTEPAKTLKLHACEILKETPGDKTNVLFVDVHMKGEYEVVPAANGSRGELRPAGGKFVASKNPVQCRGAARDTREAQPSHVVRT